jgi:hypothetical protein
MNTTTEIQTMTTKQLRAAMKAVDPEARVSGGSDGLWTVRTEYKLSQVRDALTRLGMREYSVSDIEGSSYNWTHVLFVKVA